MYIRQLPKNITIKEEDFPRKEGKLSVVKGIRAVVWTHSDLAK